MKMIQVNFVNNPDYIKIGMFVSSSNVFDVLRVEHILRNLLLLYYLIFHAFHISDGLEYLFYKNLKPVIVIRMGKN